MKKVIVIIAALLLTCMAANGQSFLKNLGERAKNAVENKISEKVENTVNRAVDKAAEKAEKKIKGKKGAEAEAKAAEVEKQVAEQETVAEKPVEKPVEKTVKKVQASYAKTDFVPGDEIFFEDTFENEKVGEFPLRWELLDGYVETAEIEGRKVLAFTDDGIGEVTPLIKPEYAWLPDIFTVEFDLFIAPVNENGDSELSMIIHFFDAGEKNNSTSKVYLWYRESDGSSNISWNLGNISGQKDLTVDVKNNPLALGEWNHFAFSFNKRAFKCYINGYRIINVPSMPVPAWLSLSSGSKYIYSGVSNVRIAKGAVPLYDRLMSDGKIVTYAITFETGKADLKPESMIEINRIAKLMKENPGLEFEVQGHCDATGSDRVNDPLSQKRAEAIVAAIVEQDIAEARLTPVGKGSHSPIASNSTEEGRAKNRRVEFVKK
ncbi:MAG: OmpA family protein [Bacteroidales bacterium]|nr:OmpA family protein [Bacteroidales bacterium]